MLEEKEFWSKEKSTCNPIEGKSPRGRQGVVGGCEWVKGGGVGDTSHAGSPLVTCAAEDMRLHTRALLCVVTSVAVLGLCARGRKKPLRLHDLKVKYRSKLCKRASKGKQEECRSKEDYKDENIKQHVKFVASLSENHKH
ncbi:hypothetical protein J6590_056628 [Homalodisca vitripennis]|nr:hypothetical protein J6590_056628 [Homalodisca vitripennis]